MNPDSIITSTANPRIKALANWRAHRGNAEGEQFLIDGLREIARAAEAGVELIEAFYCPAICKAEAKSAIEQCRTRGAKCIEINEPVLEKISYGDRYDGLVVTAVRPRRSIGKLQITPKSLVAVVEAVEKPGNLGAIVRSADGAGVGAIIVVDSTTDIYGPNVIRASTGIVFSLPVYEATAADALALMQSKKVQCVAASPDARKLYTDIDYRGPTAIILGSEARGLSAIWRDSRVTPAKIPMLGKADSLNVATTAALFFYEARRQRGAV